MSGDLYDQDALAWAEHQSDLLLRLAGGERVNEAIDWAHVIGELRDVGLSELRACQSLLQQAITHLLKRHAWPDSLSALHWRDETGAFLDDAARRFTPSMRQRIALDELYARALRRVRTASDATGAPRPLPDACPFQLDELLAGDLGVLTGRLATVM